MTRPRASDLGLLVLALAAVVVVFGSGLAGDFVYDDLLLVVQNPTIRDLDRLPEALTGAYWSFLDAESAARIGYWRPLTSIALAVGHALGGGQPWGFHAVSLVLHLGATAAVFALVRQLRGSPVAALAGALVFGLHPVQVEAVAWISAVNDPLAGLMVLLGLLGFLRWRERGSTGVPLATATCLALALLAKESGAALIPLAVVIDLGRPTAEGTPRKALLRPFVRAYAPLLVVAAGYWAARAVVFGDWRGGFDRITSHLFLPLSRAITLRVELLGGALELLAWPADLNLFREVRPEVPVTDPGVVRAILVVALWAAALVGCAYRRAPRVLAALLIVPAGILPGLIRFESIGRFPLSERFLYLSVVGAALLAALLVSRLPAKAGMALLVLAGTALGLRSHARIGFWSDELTLFESAAIASPESLYVQWGRGRVLLAEYRRTSDPALLEEAHRAFLLTQDLGSPPDGSPPPPSRLVTPHDLLQANLGVGWYFFLCSLRSDACGFNEAELVFRETAKRAEGELFTTSRSHALTGLGFALLYQDRFEEAEQALREAVVVAPSSQAWFALGQLERRRRSWEAAVENFRRALELAPGDVAALIGLAEALVQSDRGAEARSVLTEALERAPEDPEVRVQLGALHGREGRPEKALEWLDSALTLDGRLGNAHLLRAKALVQLGDVPRAVRAFQEACRWMPDSFDAHYNLGVLLLQNGLNEDAVPYLERAIEIDPDGEYAALIQETLDGL